MRILLVLGDAEYPVLDILFRVVDQDGKRAACLNANDLSPRADRDR